MGCGASGDFVGGPESQVVRVDGLARGLAPTIPMERKAAPASVLGAVGESEVDDDGVSVDEGDAGTAFTRAGFNGAGLAR